MWGAWLRCSRDNGAGVRGDMKAVIQAILLDDEARNAGNAAANPQYGKVSESLVRYTQWARAFTAQSRNGSFNIGSTEDRIYGLGRDGDDDRLRSSTGSRPATRLRARVSRRPGLVAPEMQMTDVSTVVGYLNYMQCAIGSDSQNGSDIYFELLDRSGRLGQTPDALVDRINLPVDGGHDGQYAAQPDSQRRQLDPCHFRRG